LAQAVATAPARRTAAPAAAATALVAVALAATATAVALRRPWDSDSIGDGGGQGPYYDQLLHGSLQQKYGAVQLVNEADSGSKSSALPGQIAGLPPALPGPVVVAITSGGNDMKDALGLVLTGLDGVAVQTMGNNIGAALDLLLAPGRFGSGVEVHVYEASIYDASDGQGNFGSGGCVVNLDGPPTDPMFDKWNDAIAEPLMLRGQTLVPMHDHFYGHGFNNPPNWYAGDCTHPNSTGHDELHALFYQSITGESL
jgi:lysophospholipase L1-like esterase